jgi:hypothetical protein
VIDAQDLGAAAAAGTPAGAGEGDAPVVRRIRLRALSFEALSFQGLWGDPGWGLLRML